jgi:hypothetical protein
MPQWPDSGYNLRSSFSSGSCLDVVVWLQGAPTLSHRARLSFGSLSFIRQMNVRNATLCDSFFGFSTFDFNKYPVVKSLGDARMESCLETSDGGWMIL